MRSLLHCATAYRNTACFLISSLLKWEKKEKYLGAKKGVFELPASVKKGKNGREAAIANVLEILIDW